MKWGYYLGFILLLGFGFLFFSHYASALYKVPRSTDSQSELTEDISVVGPISNMWDNPVTGFREKNPDWTINDTLCALVNAANVNPFPISCPDVFNVSCFAQTTYPDPPDGYTKTITYPPTTKKQKCTALNNGNSTTFYYNWVGYYRIERYYYDPVLTPPKIDITIGINGGPQESKYVCPTTYNSYCGTYGSNLSGCFQGGEATSPTYTDCNNPQLSSNLVKVGEYDELGECAVGTPKDNQTAIRNLVPISYTVYNKCPRPITTTDRVKICWSGYLGESGTDGSTTPMNATFSNIPLLRWDSAISGNNAPPVTGEYGSIVGANYGPVCRDNLYFSGGLKEVRSDIFNADGGDHNLALYPSVTPRAGETTPGYDGTTGQDYEQLQVGLGALSCTQTSPPTGSTIATGQNVTFAGSGGGGIANQYAWSTSGGSPNSANGSTFSTSWSTAGTKTVTLSDSSGASSVNCPVTITACTAPSVDVTVVPVNVCFGVASQSADVSWTYTPGSCGFTQDRFQLQIDPFGSSFGNNGLPEYDSCYDSAGNPRPAGFGPNDSTCTSGHTETFKTTYPKNFKSTYKTRVRVWDTAGKVSNWDTSQTWKTFQSPDHPLPWPRFTYSPSIVTVDKEVTFDGSATTFDPAGTGRGLRWEFGDADSLTSSNMADLVAKHTYTAVGSFSVTLTASDDAGSCTTPPQTLGVGKKIPFWREILPKF